MTYIKSPIFYMGNKYRLLPQLLPLFPSNIDTFYDLFGGSGTALITCESLERICYMMELDDKYVSVIVRRYIEYTGGSDDIYCLRDGKKIPYSELVNANEEAQEVQAD